MGSIFSYQKFIDNINTVELQFPQGESGNRLGQELATIDGTTYCFVDGVLPKQSEKIAKTVQEIVISDELKAQLNQHSPVLKLIDQQTRDKIAEKYSIQDEIKMLRLGGEAFAEYNDYVELCRNEGKAKKAEFGL